MNTESRSTRIVSDLAGYWTEPVLKILKQAGNRQGSVQSEIEAWHALDRTLQGELAKQLSVGSDSLAAVKEKVINRVSSELAEKYNLTGDVPRQSTQDRRLSAAEHILLGDLVGRPGGSGEVRSARQTDFMPRLHLAAAM